VLIKDEENEIKEGLGEVWNPKI